MVAVRGRPRAFHEEEAFDIGDDFWPYVVQVLGPAQPGGAGPGVVGQCRNPWHLLCLVPAVRPGRGG
jgi:hypothetical protein